MSHQNGQLKNQLREILERRQGRSRAITGRQLANFFNHRDDRTIRMAIRELIADGLPVLSSTEPPAGYFLASTWEELHKASEIMRSRIIEDCRRLKDMKQSVALYLKPAEQGKLL